MGVQMYLMYVDESGDIGLNNSPTRYFALTGLVIHELVWQNYLDQIIRFRKQMKTTYNLHLRDELHASHFINRPGDLVRIQRHHRLNILRLASLNIASLSDVRIINILVDKQGKPATYDVFGASWSALIQRFENTLVHRNFPGPWHSDERGILSPDNTDNKKLTKLLRKMRRFNPVPSKIVSGYRVLPLHKIVEDPYFKDSRHSYFIQACDVAAYLMYQFITPNNYFRRCSARNYFLNLDTVLCKIASTSDPYGIVRL